MYGCRGSWIPEKNLLSETLRTLALLLLAQSRHPDLEKGEGVARFLRFLCRRLPPGDIQKRSWLFFVSSNMPIWCNPSAGLFFRGPVASREDAALIN